MTRMLIRFATLAGLFVAAPAAAEQFTILIYETPDQLALRTAQTPEGQAYWAAFDGIGKEMGAAGILKGGAALTGNAGLRTVEVRDGKVEARDGGVASAPNQLGGYFIIDVAGIDQAVEWAAKIPSAATGSIEVRPHFAVPGMSQ